MARDNGARDEPGEGSGGRDQVPDGVDAEAYRFGWDAGSHATMAFRDWGEVEATLRERWLAEHPTLDTLDAQEWEQIVGAVRGGWDAAHRELQSEL